MDPATRRFAVWLSAFAGVVLVLGGFLFAYTIDGAVMIWTGLASFLFAAALAVHSPWWFATAIAAALDAALITYTIAVYPG